MNGWAPKMKQTTTDSLVLIECDSWSLCLSDKPVPPPSEGRRSKAAMGLSCLVICSSSSVLKNAE